jgi:hypothetical protein
MRAVSRGLVTRPVGLPTSTKAAGRLRQEVSFIPAGPVSQSRVIVSSGCLAQAARTRLVIA